MKNQDKPWDFMQTQMRTPDHQQRVRVATGRIAIITGVEEDTSKYHVSFMGYGRVTPRNQTVVKITKAVADSRGFSGPIF